MGEYRTSALLGYLGAIKIVNLLYHYVWWPKLHETVTAFYKEYEVYAKTKVLTATSPGALQPLLVHPKRFNS